MSVTFLLGNGFDRALGLKTNYAAFYKWYCARPTAGLTPWVKEFRGEIQKYISKDPNADAYWSDAEYGLGQYTEKFTLETSDRFGNCFDDFRDNLIVYLKGQQALLSDEMADSMAAIFTRQISEFIQEIDPIERPAVIDSRNRLPAEDITLNFVCFNYTNAINQVFSALAQKSLGQWRGTDGRLHKLILGKLIRAHGTLEQWPIIGVCNPQSIKNQELLKSPLFKATMLKSESISISGELWRKNASEIIKSSRIICVFGMSLGETDSDYWEIIANWLTGDSYRHLIVFWHDVKAGNVNLSIPAKFTEVNRVKKKLLDFSSWSDEQYEKVSKRIHVVLKSPKMFVLPDENKVQQPEKGLAMSTEELIASVEQETPVT